METDKASMEIPIDYDCTIKDILVKEGDLISPGQAIMIINKNDSEDTISNQDKDEIIEERVVNNDDMNTQKEILSTKNIHATPIVKKEAKKLGIDINEISCCRLSILDPAFNNWI